MTRINLVPVEELSDQHLIAEYRELPRVIKQNFNIDDAPERYTLGKGHVKWGRKHAIFIMRRYECLCEEMTYRGFKVNQPFYELYKVWEYNCGPENDNWYNPTKADIALSRNRLVEKYREKPEFYKWTKRVKPAYYIKELSWWEKLLKVLSF